MITKMNSRLQQFLDLEKLSPARLADMLGVQRSGLSHILSGRNKPGYDFIYKLLTCFPTISAEWLLTGKGKPYKDINEITPSPFSHFNKTEQEQNHNKVQILDKNDDIFSISSSFDNMLNTENYEQEIDNQLNNLQNKQSKLSQNGVNGESNKNMRKNKTVNRVIIFYNDGSFDEMYPTS